MSSTPQWNPRLSGRADRLLRVALGGEPALPFWGITSEPVPLDKNGWHWKPSQLPGASEITDLRKESTITTWLDEHVFVHPKSYP